MNNIVTDPDKSTVYFKDGRLVRKQGRKHVFADGEIVRGNKQAKLRVKAIKKPLNTQTESEKAVLLEPVNSVENKQREPEFYAFKKKPFREQLMFLLDEDQLFMFTETDLELKPLLEELQYIPRTFLNCFITLCASKAIKCTHIDSYVRAFCLLSGITFVELYRALKKQFKKRGTGHKPLLKIRDMNESRTMFAIDFRKHFRPYGIFRYLSVNKLLPKTLSGKKPEKRQEIKKKPEYPIEKVEITEKRVKPGTLLKHAKKRDR